VIAAGVLAELDKTSRIIAALARLADDQIPNHHCVAVGRTRFGGIDQPHFAILRIGDVVVEQFGVMPARLEVLSIEGVVDGTEADGGILAAQIEVMAVSIVEGRAIEGDLTRLNDQITVLVAHDAHVTLGDPASAHRHVVG
jgi:hypothetical protein